MTVSENSHGLRWWHEFRKGHAPPADMQIVTSDGQRIAAHSHVLASASPVLEDLVYRPRKNWNSERVIEIRGVSSDVVFAFLQFISSSRSALSSREGKEAMEKYGVQLMVLAHKYRVGWLKRGCEIAVGMKLTPENAVDVLQIARLSDASILHLKCMGVVMKEFAKVEKSDGWRFVQMNDPRLELEILQFLQQTDQRRKRGRRERGEQEMYRQLGDVMDCLEHICTEGCTRVGPHDRTPASNGTGPCTKFPTCEGLQPLIRHLVTCSKKLSSKGAACSHCKRMWQLFRLHSSLCGLSESACKVPLCKQFKLKMQMDGKGDDATWRLLAKKVAVARVMCSLAKRKRPEEPCNLRARSYRCIK